MIIFSWWLAVAAPPTLPVRVETPSFVGQSTQGELRLSLDEATALALRNSLDLEVRKLRPVESKAQILEARAEFDPELFIEADVLQERASQTARATGERFDVEGQNSQARLGLRGRLVSGTEYEAGLEHTLENSDRTPRQQSVRLGLSIRQNLLQGFGPKVNRVGQRQAELSFQASRWELQGFVEQLVVSTEQSYWALVLSERRAAIVAASLEVEARALADVRASIEIGQSARLDDAPIAAELERRRLILIDARAQVRTRGLELSRLLNLRPLDRSLVVTSTLPQVEPQARVAEARVASAQRLRAELKEARSLSAREALQTVVTQNGLLPRLDFFVELGKTGFSDRTFEAFASLDAPTYDVRAGLSLSRLVSNRQARADDLRASAGAAQAEVAVRNLERQVELEVLVSLAELERAEAQVEATARSQAAQQRVVEGERERFDAGAGTALLLARARRELLEARLATAEARVAHRLARIRLHRAEGSLLARREIYVGPSNE